MFDTATERIEYIYLVVTVLKTKFSYRIRKITRELKLAPNEFALKIKVSINKDDWFKRIMEVDVGKIVPPSLPKPEVLEIIVEKDTPQKVIDRLAGR